MIVIKRNGQEVEYDESKIVRAVQGAVNDVYPSKNLKFGEDIGKGVADEVTTKISEFSHAVHVEDIQDTVEDILMDTGRNAVAKAYIKYRYEHELARKGTRLSDKVKSIVDSTNEDVIQENANKNPHINSTQRDYIAGEVSKQITFDELLPQDIVDAHNAGIIHFHDADYYVTRMFNCLHSKTSFYTDEGPRQFRDCYDGEVLNVLAGDGVFRPATVRRYGKERMNKVTFKSGNSKNLKEVVCTPGHRWILTDGTVTTSLQVGHKLTYLPDWTSENHPQSRREALMFTIGFCIGDGSDSSGTYRNPHSDVTLCVEREKDYRRIFLIAGWREPNDQVPTDGYIRLTYNGFCKQEFLNNEMWKYLSHSDKRWIFEGLYAADGSRSNKSKTIESSDRRVMKLIEATSYFAGYFISSTKQVVASEDSYKPGSESTCYQFVTHQAKNGPWEVVSIEDTKSEYDCWCVEEPVTKSFVLTDGMITGNCCLLNLDDMLQNGTMISGTLIERPHSFSTACNIATQIIAQVASNQYGGQSISLAALAPFVDVSRQKIRKQVESEYSKIIRGQMCGDDISAEERERTISEIVEERVREEVTKGIQTIQYQVITLMTTNGQAPFITVWMYIDEVPEGQTRDDLALIIEETIKQRYQGIKNENGAYITTAFPKLIYCLDEDNITEDSKYWYLTKLAAKCSAKRLVPDYVSAKMMRKLKLSKGEVEGEGDIYPPMGAAAGYERVSIKIDNKEYNDIRIDEAIHLIRCNMEHKDTQMPDNPFSHLRGVCGVYKLTHIPTGLFYVGSSKDIERRLSEHRYTLRHQQSLGDNYFIGDDNIFNLDLEVLEKCDLDYLSVKESEWYSKLNSELCVNRKDPVNNGNFDSENRLLALEGMKHSNFENKSYNRYRRLDGDRVKVKSGFTWVPVRSIIVNTSECPLKLYKVGYQVDRGEVRYVTITEDHPLHTHRGRVECRNLVEGDGLLSEDMETYYSVVSLREIPSLPTYDFETDTDTFNLSGLLSHNCRSFLTPDRSGNGWSNIANAKNYEHGTPKYFGRFNQGVVTINLVDVALSAHGQWLNSEESTTMDDLYSTFWDILEDRLELCHRALRYRHERLLGTLSDSSPIHWQHGGLARIEKGETIDKLLYGGYSTISLGYAGLYECVKAITGRSHTDDETKPFALAIMKNLNDKCAEWKAAEDIDYSVYGTPIESTTYKFSKCLQKRFGVIPGITDKNYITNSYHVHVTEEIDPFTKLKFESEFQELSPGGAISYIESSDLTGNIDAMLDVIQFIYDNIMYAEINCKSDYCQVCGYDGEIDIVENKHKKLIWKCPNCGNTDRNKMNVARRVCGYISTNDMNQGRTQEIKERYVHLGGE